MSDTSKTKAADGLTLHVRRLSEPPDFCRDPEYPNGCDPDDTWIEVVDLHIPEDVWVVRGGVRYTAATRDAECYEAIGRKVASLLLGEDAVYKE